MRSLLSGIAPADTRLDPFPHIVVPDVFEEDIHRALNESFPPFSVIGWAGNRPPGSNRRYQLSAWQIMEHPALPPVWKAFVAYHASPAFFAEVVALFRDHWPEAMIEALDGDLLGHPMGLLMRDGFDRARILQDARMEINTPVTAGPSTSRGPPLSAYGWNTWSGTRDCPRSGTTPVSPSSTSPTCCSSRTPTPPPPPYPRRQLCPPRPSHRPRRRRRPSARSSRA